MIIIKPIYGQMLPHLTPVVKIKPRTVIFGYYLEKLDDDEHQILFYSTSGRPFVDELIEFKDNANPPSHTFEMSELCKLGENTMDSLNNLFRLCRSNQRDLYYQLCKSQIIDPYRKYQCWLAQVSAS